jgi:hypothetical protein
VSLASGSDHVNEDLLEGRRGSDRIKAALGVNDERLVVVKNNRYDPMNLFRHNQNFKPTV